MRVEVVSEGRAGSRRNDDVAGYGRAAAWVLDGAGVPPGLAEESGLDAGWYVGCLSTALAHELLDGEMREPEELVAAAIGKVAAVGRARFPAAAVASWPSATLTLVRVRGESLDYLVLGDSPLLVATREGVELVTDRRLREVAPDLRAEIRRRLLTGEGYRSRERERLVHELVLQERRQRNVEGGYWIAGAEPWAAEHAVTGTLALGGPGPVTAVALLTDGFARSLDPFGLYRDPAALMGRLLQPGGPAVCLREVREAERLDPDGRRCPRTSASDDATALTWSLC